MKLKTSTYVTAAAVVFLSATTSAHEQNSLNASIRASIVDSIALTLDSIYVFPDVAASMAAKIRAELQNKSYDACTDGQDFAQKLTADLRSVSNDKHVWVAPLPPGQSPQLTPEELAADDRAERKYFNYGFKELRWLDGNVGYIKLNSFAPAEMGGPTAIAAMNFFGGADALIFDLRENGGGDPSMIQLISSYLFDEPTHLNDFFLRADSSIQQFWTQASVTGPKLTDVPVYVLTSDGTFSAAEEFSYNLKNLKRGTIVGQTTGGGAHPNQFIRFPTLGVQISVAFGRAINPVTGTNWEGTGVTPDIECDQGDALLTAHLDALKKLRSTATDERVARALDWTIEGLDANLHPFQPGAKDLVKYAGDFGPRKVTVENGDLWYQRGENPKRKLLPLRKDNFQLDGVNYFRVHFILDGAGNVVELEGRYDNGHVDRNRRGEQTVESGG